MPTYACVGSDGVIFLIQPNENKVDMNKITGLDSQAIGIYEK